MPRSVLTLGTFDGVHRGHRAILERVVRRARHLRAQSVVLAFDMPPRHTGEKGIAPVLLTTLSEKLEILRELGVDQVRILRFTPRLASIEPEIFLQREVIDRWGAVEMIVGPRVAFGKDRRGRLKMLQSFAKMTDLRVSVVRSISAEGDAVASRKIRRALEKGDVTTAQRMLGYPYSAEGRVIHGDHRGRSMGYPTANLQIPAEKILPRGVFWVKVTLAAGRASMLYPNSKRLVDGLCNVGWRPTFSTRGELRCEVYLFQSPGRLYGRPMRIYFQRKLRDERRFPNAAALIAQIALDFRRARDFVAAQKK